MKKSIYSLMLFALLAPVMYAQHIPQWSYQNVGSDQDKTADLAVIGSVSYVAGTFADSLVVDTTVLRADSLTDIFLLSLNGQGTVNWCRRFGSKGDDAPSKLTTDGELLYMAGVMTDSVTGSKEKKRLFIKAITPEGNEKWDLPVGISGKGSVDVLIPGPGHMLLAGGAFEGCLTLPDKQYSSGKGSKAFTLLVTSEGVPVSCSVSEGKGRHRLVAACFDHNGNQYQMTALGKKSVVRLMPDGKKELSFAEEGLLVEKSTPGDDNWSVPVEGTGFIEGVNLHCDAQGNVYAGVNYNRAINAGGTTQETDGQLAGAVVVITPQGKVDALRPVTGYDYCRMMDFSVGTDGSLLLAGYEYGGFREDSAAAKTGSTGRNTFISEMNPAGKPVWHDELTTTVNYGRAVAFGGEGNLLVTGAYTKAPGENSLKGSKPASPAGGVYVNSYHYCHEKRPGLTAPAGICKGDTLTLIAPEGFDRYVWNGITSASNTCIVTTPGKTVLRAYDGFGCLSADSVIIALKPDAEARLGADTTLYPGDVLSVAVDSACSGFTWADGYTGRSRTIPCSPSAGSLKLIVKVSAEGRCPSGDTLNISFKNAVAGTGEGFGLFPNPARDDVTWWFDDGTPGPFTLEIIEPGGTLLRSEEFPASKKGIRNTLDVSSLSDGSYLVRVRSAGRVQTVTIVKQ